ncbi:hypothetical protein [Paenibacillus barengoltzii]|uniref:Uncharacterized protein n=1 Tax=Paenibacillus barengoltzii J12 TaxID=935846 RepID=A0ABY1LXL9_9BACL|nr:hypothetical protein [Paenibacillus barengoltzii]MEC2344778.1 hypothetical protein [Paenibacillus barengoltzii]SMF27545.1 hypothetical protein SAMN02744124_02211 [Paenibacillus barengoltzii J12]
MKRGNLKLKQGTAPVSKASKHLSPSMMMDAKRTKGRKLPSSRPKGILYIGPSVEGGDKEYVKVLTGDVDRTKPSFV